MLENDDGDLASDRISQNALIYVPVRADGTRHIHEFLVFWLFANCDSKFRLKDNTAAVVWSK